MKISKTAIQEKIDGYNRQIQRLQDKVKSLEYTLEEFSDDRNTAHRRFNPQVKRGEHPKAVKEILKKFPIGLTSQEIIRMLRANGHEIKLNTLLSVLNRDGGKTIKKEQVTGGRGYRYSLKQPLLLDVPEEDVVNR